MNPFQSDTELLAHLSTTPAERDEALRQFYCLPPFSPSRQLTTFVRRKGGSAQDAKDLCHETFITSVKKLNEGKFEMKSSLKTWAFGIGKNLWRNERRKKKPEPTDQPEKWSGAEPSVEEDYLLRERDRLVREAIEQLTEEEQKMVRLKMEGFSFKKISLALGHPNEKYTENTWFRQCLPRLKAIFESKQ